MRRFLPESLKDESGSAVVEFALVGPVLIAMLMGVFHVGMAMQNYNALRSASADVARYAVVNYQSANKLNDTQLTAYCRSIATHAPYALRNDNLIDCTVTAAATRVAGVTEKTITLEYRVPTLLSMIGVRDVVINYERPVFLSS